MEKLSRKIIQKGFPIFALKNCTILKLVHFLSNFISPVLVFTKIFMEKKVGIKATNDEIHVLQRLLSAKSPLQYDPTISHD